MVFIIQPFLFENNFGYSGDDLGSNYTKAKVLLLNYGPQLVKKLH